jgi:hypothetical protein
MSKVMDRRRRFATGPSSGWLKHARAKRALLDLRVAVRRRRSDPGGDRTSSDDPSRGLLPERYPTSLVGSGGKDQRALWPALMRSGRADSNRRPPAPKAGALTRLRYAPCDLGFCAIIPMHTVRRVDNSPRWPMSSDSVVTAASVGEVRFLLASFVRNLRARNLSPRTIETYSEGCNQFAAFLEERGMPAAVESIRREHVEAWIESLLQQWKPATASNRYRALQSFFKWCVEEGEISDSPMARMRPPQVPETPPDVLTEK